MLQLWAHGRTCSWPGMLSWKFLCSLWSQGIPLLGSAETLQGQGHPRDGLENPWHEGSCRGKAPLVPLEVLPRQGDDSGTHPASFFTPEHKGLRNDEAHQTNNIKICTLQRLSCSIPQQPSVGQAPVPRYQTNNDSFPFCVCKSIVIMP